MTDISHYLSLPYTRILKRDDEGDIVATIAELDGCMAHGADESEALQNLRDAQAAWLEAAIATEQDIPLPETEEDELPSGKFVVRLPRSLHARLNVLARKDNVSLNQVMVMAATEHVARRESRQAIAHALDHAWQRKAKAAPWVFPAQKGDSEFLKQVQERGLVGAVSGKSDPHFKPRSRRG